jgi:hypothetical protein
VKIAGVYMLISSAAILPNRKRPAATVMLGSGWSSAPARTTCKCNRHNGRKECSDDKKAKMDPAYLCAACGGTRKAGDAWTECDVLGPITLCGGCHKIIAPDWVLSATERQEMEKAGVDYKELVRLNADLRREESSWKEL